MDLNDPLLAAFLATAVMVEITPGPNMLWLALMAVTEGRRTALAAVAGVALGLAVQGALAAAGVSILVQSYPALYQALLWGGAAYLLWMAWESWKDADDPLHHQPGGGETVAKAFSAGLITNLLNPKAALFYLALLPGFLPTDSQPADAALLVSLYVLVATAIHLAIVLAAATARRLFNTPKLSARLHRVQALGLVLVSLWIILKT